MEWSKEKPKESGFYWFYYGQETGNFYVDDPAIVKIYGSTVYGFQDPDPGYPLESHPDGFWMGPIKEPERPQQ